MLFRSSAVLQLKGLDHWGPLKVAGQEAAVVARLALDPGVVRIPQDRVRLDPPIGVGCYMSIDTCSMIVAF